MKLAKSTTICLGMLLIFSASTKAIETADGNGDIELRPPLSIVIPAPEVIPGVVHPPLENVKLDLDQTIRLDRPYIMGEQAQGGCIERPETSVRFCIDPMGWPASLKQAFGTSDVIHKGNQAIIRYDQDKSSQAHILFPADQFVDVVEYLKNRFGPPSSEDAVITQVPEKNPVVNTVVRWRSIMNDNAVDMVLEVRAYDDVRRPFPDSSHGFVWLHRKGVEPMFRHLSMVDLMVLRKRRIGQWPFTEQSPQTPTQTEKSPTQ
jgi:hypothetical protein